MTVVPHGQNFRIHLQDLGRTEQGKMLIRLTCDRASRDLAGRREVEL